MKFKDFCRINIPRVFPVSLIIFAVCMLIKGVCVTCAPFADFFNRYVASAVRAVPAYITTLLPFSLAEAIIIMALPLALLYILYCIIHVSRNGNILRHVFGLLSVCFLVFSAFTVCLDIGYDCTPIEEKMGLDRESVGVEDVYDACVILLEEIKECEGNFDRNERGVAVMPYSFLEMGKRLNASYKNLSNEYGFIPPLYAMPKRIALSKPMAYTSLAGIYTFFTGEANVNTSFSHYSTVFTAAHEMAHQRGVAPEDEASFVAFLACYNSEDDYIKYCAMLEAADRLSNDVYEADVELFEKLLDSFSTTTIDEYVNYAADSEEYGSGTAAEVADAVNDAYLKMQGEEGIKSYSLVTTLITAYLLEN